MGEIAALATGGVLSTSVKSLRNGSIFIVNRNDIT